VMTDKRVVDSKPTAEQLAMLERVRNVLTGAPAPGGKGVQLGVSLQSLEGSRYESKT